MIIDYLFDLDFTVRTMYAKLEVRLESSRNALA